jgi:hypothetical protein
MRSVARTSGFSWLYAAPDADGLAESLDEL